MTRPLKGSLEIRYYGVEPKEYNLSSLNWYSYFCNKKDYIDFFKVYIKAKKLKVLIPDYIPSSIAIAMYFVNTKRELPENIEIKLNDFVSKLEVNNKEDEELENASVKKTVLDYVKEQAINLCSILDGEIDALLNDFNHKFDIHRFSLNIKAPQAKIIKEFYEKQYNDTLIDDEFTKEGYSYMSNKEFKIYQKFLKDIIDTMAVKMIPKKKAIRKKKPTPAYKKVEKLKYLDMSKTFNITSESPEKIIGSDLLMTFDTKTCILSVYIAEKGGFDVSGTSIKNISGKSFKKKLRKPEEFLKNINKTKLQLLRQIEELNTKSSKISPRINDRTVLLRLF